MYLNTLDVKLTPRNEEDSYNLEINESTLDTLALILEFKAATSWHISRFLTGKDQSKYIYTKLRRMWKAGLLESFKVYSGTLAGIPVFYMLSKAALKLLEEQGRYKPSQLQTYPEAKQLLSWGLFKHEAQVVELASMEIKNKADNFEVNIKGEISSLSRDLISNKNIEVFTPDYTVWYKTPTTHQCIYTEFERTIKSKEAILRKIERYLGYLGVDDRKDKTLRFIFQTSAMEQAFWLNLISNGSTFLQKIRIITTNLSLLDTHKRFLEEIYLSDKTVKLIKQGSLKVDTTERIKLFSSV